MNVVVRPGPLLSALRVSGVAHMSYIHHSDRLLLLLKPPVGRSCEGLKRLVPVASGEPVGRTVGVVC